MIPSSCILFFGSSFFPSFFLFVRTGKKIEEEKESVKSLPTGTPFLFLLFNSKGEEEGEKEGGYVSVKYRVQ